MYSVIKNVQVLVKLLKEHNIRNIVMSPGGSDIPIIHTIEMDDFFNCYSVVDERNATYFALGLSQEKNEPVACVCTSGTAICNYLPGITEAYYQNAQVIAITADKNPIFQDQLETQKIDQMNTFKNVVKASVDLPVIRDDNDEWICNRLVNEALIEMNHHGKGPIHINIPIVGDTSKYIEGELKEQRVIKLLEEPINENEWKEISDKLLQKQKILIVVGQNMNFKKDDYLVFEEFFKHFNCCIAVEHLSNLNCKGTMFTYPITEMGGVNNEIIPDLVISIGNNLSAYNLKPFLRNNYKRMENWLISKSGKVRDAYKSLTYIFECNEMVFFKKMNEYATNHTNNMNYYNQWKKLYDMVKLPDLEFSNMYVAKRLSENIPPNSLLHLAILNSTRTMQFFKLNEGVKTYSNVGALGIDGCLATFAGQAAATDQKAFLLIGDLSFFYGMNGAALKSIGKNVRIILQNNGGGSEFHFFMGKHRISTINDYISAEHGVTAKGWIESLGYDYYSAKSSEEFDELMNIIVNDSERPIFIEVFSNMEEDACRINKMYDENKLNYSLDIGGIQGVKALIKSKLSDNNKQKIKKFVNKIRKGK